MTRQPLVLLPGLLCDDEVWASQITALGDVADCVCVDYGELDSLRSMAEKVLRVAPPRFAVAGHSMGGRVALEVYRLAPERVTRIGLFDTAFAPLPAGDAGERERRSRYALLEVAQNEGMGAMARQWLPPMLHPENMKNEALFEAIIRMLERKTPLIHAAQIKALLERPDATAVLASIRCPALMLTGGQDAWSPPSIHQTMAQAVPGSRLVVIPNCGHMAPMESPEAVTAAMRDWLAAPAVLS